MKSTLKFMLPLVIGGVLISGNISAQTNKNPENMKKEGKVAKKKDAMMEDKSMTATINNPASDLRAAMRRLWDDHVVWTRNVIFCIIDDAPGTDEAVARLMKNQDDIGNAIKPYYGSEAGKKLTELLRTHISQAAELLKAAKKDDNKTFDELNKQWKANADEIAMFLSNANPANWKAGEMKTMMQDHLKYTLDEATARKKKDYDADVKAFDKVDEEILKMADMLTEGIVKQFPEKFKAKEMMGMK